jgi:hypothetical protein
LACSFRESGGDEFGRSTTRPTDSPLPCGLMTTTKPRLPTGIPFTVAEVVDLLRHFGIDAGLRPERADEENGTELAQVELAYGLIGAAERNAMNAEAVARRVGLGHVEFGEAERSRYLAAGVTSDADEFALTEWRATRLAQATGQLGEVSDDPADGRELDPLVHAIETTAAALAGLLSAATTARNPHRADGETQDAAHCVRQALRAMDEARPR